MADESLHVGFSDRTLGTHLPSHHKKPGRDIRKLMQTVGILKDTGHETFRGMVTVPLLDASGTVTGIYGRRIDRHAIGEAETTIGSGIFNGTAMKNFEEIIMTDNILDAWTFYSAGYTNVICPVGYTLQIADLAKVKRVLLASASIDCEAFTSCEIFHLKLPAGQTAHQTLGLVRQEYRQAFLCSMEYAQNHEFSCFRRKRLELQGISYDSKVYNAVPDKQNRLRLQYKWRARYLHWKSGYHSKDKLLVGILGGGYIYSSLYRDRTIPIGPVNLDCCPSYASGPGPVSPDWPPASIN